MKSLTIPNWYQKDRNTKGNHHQCWLSLGAGITIDPICTWIFLLSFQNFTRFCNQKNLMSKNKIAIFSPKFSRFCHQKNQMLKNKIYPGDLVKESMTWNYISKRETSCAIQWQEDYVGTSVGPISHACYILKTAITFCLEFSTLELWIHPLNVFEVSCTLKIYVFIYLFMAKQDLCCCWGLFSSCGKWGLPCNCGEWASHCSEFYCGVQASIVVAHGLSCSDACGIFPDQGFNPCLLHWQVDSLPLSSQGSPVLHFWDREFSFFFWDREFIRK